MKISKKERNLLIILLLAVIGYLYYTFVYTNQTTMLEELKAERDMESARYAQMQQTIASEGNIDIETEQIKAELLPVAREYFGAVDQEDTIMVLNDFANASQIDVTKIAFTEPVDKPIEEPKEGEEAAVAPAPENTEGAGQDSPAPQTLENIKHMSAQVSFEGTYENLMSFLNEMGTYNKNIVSTTLNIKESTNAPIEGDVLLDFYIVKEVDKYIAKSASVFEYNNMPKTAKKSPFEGYAWAYTVTDVPAAYVSNIPSNPSFSSGFATAWNTDSDSNSNSSSNYVPDGNKENYVAKAETTASDAVSQGSLARLDVASVIFSQSLNEPGVSILADFEELKNIRTFTLDDQNDMYGDLYSNAVSGLKSYRIKYSFGAASPDSEVYVYLKDKNIVIDNQPEYIRLNTYAYEKSNNIIGIIVTDSKGMDYRVFLNKKTDWLEWKELRGHIPPEVTYPVKVKSIFVRNGSGAFKKDGQLLFDALAIKN